jgi:hypothetical protein
LIKTANSGGRGLMNRRSSPLVARDYTCRVFFVQLTVHLAVDGNRDATGDFSQAQGSSACMRGLQRGAAVVGSCS